MENNDSRIWAHRDRSIIPQVRKNSLGMRVNPTDAEHRMWQQLRREFRTSHFRRQVVIAGSITDFASHRARLVIEIDGGQHADEFDTVRTKTIEREGYRVLRFWNNDVLQNMPGVCELIHATLETTTPTPDPSPQGGGA
jgi:very-short-patch-repair endonuclease